MVPKGWEVTTLGEHVTISSGYSPSKYVLAESGSFPFVKVEDMNNCAKYQSISRTYTETNGSPISKGAVIFPKRGAAIMNNKVRITDVEMYLDTNMMALTPKKSVFSEYLYYTLIKEELHKIADTSTIPQINNKHILPYRFKLPPLPEQKKIAKILSTWDNAIATTEKLIATSQQQKKALMQQLLTGKKRLGQKDSSISYKKTKYGKIPSDWDYPAIKEISKQITKKNTESQDLPVLSCSKHDGFVDSLKYFKKKVYSDDTSGYRIIPRHCFGFPSNHIEEGSIGLQDIYEQGIVSPIYVVFSCDKKRVNNLFLYAMLKTEHYRQIFCAATNASVDRRGSLRWKEFSGIHVPLPSLEEQQKIASVLTAADKEIELLQAKLAHLKDEKKALMQQLLTGKRRVKVEAMEMA